MLRALLAAICVCLVLLTAGCGGDSSPSSKISYHPFSLPASSVSQKQERTARTWLRPDENGLVGSEPKPVIPDRPPPEFVVAVDLIDSFSVPVSDDGDRLTVQYVGYGYATKQKFASSWDEGKPLAFTLGKGEVIKGWEEGLKRMEIGDRREVVVPPDYATGGSLLHGIPANSTLVFVVEALAIDES
jgi:peptidylprolyl isomerase